MLGTLSSLQISLERAFEGALEVDPYVANVEDWRKALYLISEYLRRDAPITSIEYAEAILKRILRMHWSHPVTGDEARFIAEWSRDLGFILKRKPYGIKCSTVLGYSVFFLRPQMGFSFQRHVTHKTEILHILEPLPGARVFLSSSEEWISAYDTYKFAEWLQGKEYPEYERFVLHPKAGDVYPINELSVVHTVLGCTLEEFATVSTDMVERLHDQNHGVATPNIPPRFEIEQRLKRIPSGLPRTELMNSADSLRYFSPRPFGNGVVVTLSSSRQMAAERYQLNGGNEFRFASDSERARVIFVSHGNGEMQIRAVHETKPNIPWLPFEAGQVFLLPPATQIDLRTVSDVAIASHRMALVALEMHG